jgi:hypothetical protein
MPMNTNDSVKYYKNNKLADMICILTKSEINAITFIQMLGAIIKNSTAHWEQKKNEIFKY